MVVDLYELLGVPGGAGPREIKGAYRRMAEVYHPDKLNLLPESAREEGEDIMRLLNEAKDTLLNPDRRIQYDLLLTGGTRTVMVNEMEVIEPELVSAKVKGGGILSQMSRVLGSMREAYSLDHEFTAKIVQAQEIVEARVLEENDDESEDSSYPRDANETVVSSHPRRGVGSESVHSDGVKAREGVTDVEEGPDLEMTLRFSILKKGDRKKAKPRKKGFRIVAVEGSDDGAVDADWEDDNESDGSSNLLDSNGSKDPSNLRGGVRSDGDLEESNRSESIGSDHIRSVKVGKQYETVK